METFKSDTRGIFHSDKHRLIHILQGRPFELSRGWRYTVYYNLERWVDGDEGLDAFLWDVQRWMDVSDVVQSHQNLVCFIQMKLS